MTSLPKTFKAAVLETPGQSPVLRDIPLEMPGPGELLVKVLACGLCGSDAQLCKSGLGGMEKPLPLVPGHEIVGDVVAVGPGIDKNAAVKGASAVGDRVGGAWHGGHDQVCDMCQRGLFQICDHREVTGVTRNGGWAEYVLLRAMAAVPLPRECDPVSTAPLLCAGITVFNSLRQLKLPQGSLVGVQGFGALGHLAAPFARAMGYEVAVISASPAKRADALARGASFYVDASAPEGGSVGTALKAHGGADAIICTAPTPDGMSALVDGLRPLGTLLVLSPVRNAQFDLTPFVLNGLRVVGWPSGHSRDCKETVAFATSHGVASCNETFKFTDFDKAYARLISGKARYKVVVNMQ